MPLFSATFPSGCEVLTEPCEGSPSLSLSLAGVGTHLRELKVLASTLRVPAIKVSDGVSFHVGAKRPVVNRSPKCFFLWLLPTVISHKERNAENRLSDIRCLSPKRRSSGVDHYIAERQEEEVRNCPVHGVLVPVLRCPTVYAKGALRFHFSLCELNSSINHTFQIFHAQEG